MKLLVFAHTPPPHHGQSYMVQLMLEGFGGDARKKKSATPHPLGIECYHVNARFSRGLEDVGEFQGAKMFLIFWYCAQALLVRFRYGVENFYYVPAPGKRVALYRDWLVMFLCRPFFKHIILHWHAAGLAKWLEFSASMRTRAITYQQYKNADLSIVLSEFNRADAEKQMARKIAIVPVGIPDPCPDFEKAILPRRRTRTALRQKIISGESKNENGSPQLVQVLFLALCTREKGIFDAAEGVVLANRLMAEKKVPLQFNLTLVGGFAADSEREEFLAFVRQLGAEAVVQVRGFVPAVEKRQALAAADIFCFPTFYLAENQPGNLIEAMAYGLPVVTTRWRSIPSMLPDGLGELVAPRAPREVAAALVRLAAADTSAALRALFLQRHTLEQHLAGMAAAIKEVVRD